MKADFYNLRIAHTMPDYTRPNEPLLDLPEDDNVPGEHLDTQVQKAHEQLLSLKRQQEIGRAHV